MAQNIKVNRGIVRGVDPLGRVVIPKEYRNVLGMEEGEQVEMRIEGESIILTKYRPDHEKTKILNELQELANRLQSKDSAAVIQRAIGYIK